MSENAYAAAISSLGSIASAGLQISGSKAAAKKNYKYSRQLTEYQNQLNRENWQIEKERQDYLLANQNSIQKRALQDAGYSTADPNGTGVTPQASPQVSAASTSPANFLDYGSALGSIIPNMQTMESIRGMSIENGWKDMLLQLQAENTDAQTGSLKAQTNAIVSKLPAELGQLQQSIQESLSRTKLNDEQKKKVTQETDNLAKEYEMLVTRIKYLDQKEQAELANVLADAQLALSQKDVNKVQKRLLEIQEHYNKMGIFPNNFIGAIGALLGSPAGDELIPAVTTNASSWLSQMVDLLNSGVSRVRDVVDDVSGFVGSWLRSK